MKYSDSFPLLKGLFRQDAGDIDIPGTPAVIANRSFVSQSCNVLPGAGSYVCAADGAAFPAGGGDHHESRLFPGDEGLTVGDFSFEGNSSFPYSIFMPQRGEPADRVILLMHGLNERYWHKYLPWALRLMQATSSAVLLFPLAFHMNRAPSEWSSPASMRRVTDDRRHHFPLITASSFANAAISARLHAIPQRLFWSGMQSYDDVLLLVRTIRSGAHPHIRPDAQVDLFAYSIGSFLAQIIMMADEEGVFSRSRLFILCGGPTFDRMYPVSKYILDSEALIALYAFFIEHLENEFRNDARLKHYFQDHGAGRYFRAMLSYRSFKEQREQRLRELAGRIVAVALRKDEVIQPAEVLNTLNGDYRDIPIPVHILDAPYEYSHMNVFPLRPGTTAETDAMFDRVFDLAAKHLG